MSVFYNICIYIGVISKKKNHKLPQENLVRNLVYQSQVVQHDQRSVVHLKCPNPPGCTTSMTVDRRNPANQLRLVVYAINYRVLYIPGGAGFLPSTVFMSQMWSNPSTQKELLSCFMSHEKNPLTFYCTDSLLGILKMVHYNPCIPVTG